jgi:hypothetical protein
MVNNVFAQLGLVEVMKLTLMKLARVAVWRRDRSLSIVIAPLDIDGGRYVA